VDAASIIVLKNDHGVELEVPLARWFIGFLVEEKYGAICGVYVALEMNPSGDSVLEVIDSALRPQEFVSGDPRCRFLDDGKALLVQLMPDLSYQAFSALKVDNAWANAAHEVVNNIMDTFGCAVNFGPVYSWWRRYIVEAIFGKLTEHGLQRLPSTYGTGPEDTRASDPNGKAIKFRILLSELISIIYRCVRDHNLKDPSEGLQWTRPVAGIQAALCHPASGFFQQPLPGAVQRDNRLMMHVEEVTVRGDIKKGERPYFKLDRARYTNERLAKAYWLVGKRLVTYTDRRLCRIVYATIKDTGEQLGLMIPPTKWQNSNCSWRDRKLINRSGLAAAFLNDEIDPLHAWADQKAVQLQARPKSKRKHSSKEALHLARIASKMKEAKSTPQAKSIGEPGLLPEPADEFPGDPFGLFDVPAIKPTRRNI